MYNKYLYLILNVIFTQAPWNAFAILRGKPRGMPGYK